MAKQYYIKKNPLAIGSDIEWAAINGKEFYQLITSPAGKGRYFIDMDDFMIESTEAEYKDWRREKNHSDYLHEQEAQVQLLPLHDSEDSGKGDFISDIFASTEEQAITSILRKSLKEAINSLDDESYTIIDTCRESTSQYSSITSSACSSSGSFPCRRSCRSSSREMVSVSHRGGANRQWGSRVFS